MTSPRSLAGTALALAALTTSISAAAPRPASLDDRDVQRFLAARGLVTLCGAPAPDDVDLRPGPPAPGSPCVAHADLDGDGSADVAVLVAEARGARRAGVLIKARGRLTLFGAGARTAWRYRDEETGRFVRGRAPADLAARASLRPHVWRRGKPAEAAGDAIALSGGDAALAVFGDGRTWYAMPLGF